jgi:hypothetical protein
MAPEPDLLGKVLVLEATGCTSRGMGIDWGLAVVACQVPCLPMAKVVDFLVLLLAGMRSKTC